jgi:hypothetical protein
MAGLTVGDEDGSFSDLDRSSDALEYDEAITPRSKTGKRKKSGGSLEVPCDDWLT